MPETLSPELEPASLELARKFGEAYVNLLRVLSAEELKDDDREKNVDSALRNFPEKFKPFIDALLKKARVKLEERETVIAGLLSEVGASDSPENLSYLYTYLLAMIFSQNDTYHDQEFYFQILKDHVQARRLARGIFQVTVDQGMSNTLSLMGSPEDAIAGYHVSIFDKQGRQNGFVVMYDRGENKTHYDSVKLHEYHHLLYSVLFLFDSNNEIKGKDARAQLFNSFKDELIAHLITAEIVGDVDWGGIKARELVRELSNDYKNSQTVYTYLDVFKPVYRAAKQKGINVSTLIYPILTAQSFEEFDRKLKAIEQKILQLPEKPERKPEQKLFPKIINSLFGRKT